MKMKMIGLVMLSNALTVNIDAQLNIATELCENKINPNGISPDNIQFGWELTADVNNQYQSAYQIVIASSASKLQSGNYDVWNSSVIKSNQSLLIFYKGKSHFEMIEVDELAALRKDASEKDIANRLEKFYEVFEVRNDCIEGDLMDEVKTSASLR